MHSKKVENEEVKDKIVVEKCSVPVATSRVVKRRITFDVETEMVEKEEKVIRTKIDSSLCFSCHKKLKFFNTYNCRCGYNFCNKHRFYDQHDCKFDYKIESKKILKKSNPKVIAKKIEK